MARPMISTVSSATTGPWLVADHHINPMNLGLGVKMTGTLTYSVEYTYDDVMNGATPTVYTVSALSAKTANADGSITTPVFAVRLNVTAFTSGSATLTVIQSGIK